jgi:hypothetical protein
VFRQAFELSEKDKLARQHDLVELRRKPLVLHTTWFEKWNPYRFQAPQPRSLTELRYPTQPALPLDAPPRVRALSLIR